MSGYYDRAGAPMGQYQWLATFDDWQQKIVEKTKVGEAEVSTVWLGLDHSWGDGPPLIFETLVFDGEHDGWMDRYSTEEQATSGHAAVVAWLRGEGDEPPS